MKLSDAVWIAPLLEAVARGETLEMNMGTKTQPEWVPVLHEAHIGFTDHRKNYRIKPKVHEYRLYKRPGKSLHCAERNSGQAGLETHRLHIEREALDGAVQWVGPWTPVPQE